MAYKTALAAAVAIAALTSNGALAEGPVRESYNVRGLLASGDAYASWCDERSCTYYAAYVGISEEAAKVTKGQSQYTRYGWVDIYYGYYNEVKGTYHYCSGYGNPVEFKISKQLQSATIAPTAVTVYCDTSETTYDVDVSASWTATEGPYKGQSNYVSHDPYYFSRSRDSGEWYDAKFEVSVSGAPWQGLAWDTYGSIRKSTSGSFYIYRE